MDHAPENAGGTGGSGLAGGDRGRVIGCAFSAAIVAAPFLAFLIEPNLGLAVATVALAATAVVVRDAALPASGPSRGRLFLASVINAVLAIGCLLVLLTRVF